MVQTFSPTDKVSSLAPPQKPPEVILSNHISSELLQISAFEHFSGGRVKSEIKRKTNRKGFAISQLSQFLRLRLSLALASRKTLIKFCLLNKKHLNKTTKCFKTFVIA